MASVSLPLWKPGFPLDSRSVCPFFLKESLFCCFCLKSALGFLLLFFFSFSLRVTLLSIELLVFPLWGVWETVSDRSYTMDFFSSPLPSLGHSHYVRSCCFLPP